MAFCPSGCATTLPAAPSSGCNIVTRPAGVGRLIFAKCDITWTDITDLSEWTTKMTADEVHASPEIKGSKPKASFTRKKVASCRPEKVVSATKSIQFSDANADNTNFADYAFYNHIIENQETLSVAYITCDDLLYGFIADFSIELDDVRSDTNDDEMVFDGTIQWQSLLMEVPQQISGLYDILE